MPARATVPASVAIPAGATLYTFAIPTLPTTTTGTTTMPATSVAQPDGRPHDLGGPDSRFRGSRTVYRLWILHVDGVLALNGGAAIGGRVVTLKCSNTDAATVPANVTVPAGAAATTFPVTN